MVILLLSTLNTLNMNIGTSIKSIRKYKNINQGDLADRILISQTALSQIENGTSNPSPKTIKKICEVLDIPEPVLYILGIDSSDVPENRKEMYNILFPSVQKIVFEILGADVNK